MSDTNFDELRLRSDGDGETEKDQVSTDVRSSGDGRTGDDGFFTGHGEIPDEKRNVKRTTGRKKKKHKKVKIKAVDEEEEEVPLEVELESQLSLRPVTSFEQLTRDVQSLVKEIDDKAGVYNYTTEYLRMFQNLHEVREEFDAAKAEVKDLQHIRSKQDEQIKKLKLLLDKQNNIIQRKKERLFFVTSVADAALIREQETRDALGVARAQLSKMLREVERNNEDVDAADVEGEHGYREPKPVSSVQSHLLTKIKILDDELKSCQWSEKEANAKIIGLEEKNKMLVSQLDQVQRLKNSQELELELYQDILKEKDEEINNLKDSIRNLYAHRDVVAENLKGRTQECEQTAKEKTELAHKLLFSERQLGNLKTQIQVLSDKNTDLEVSLKDKISEIRLFRSRIEKLTTQDFKLMRENAKVLKKVNDLQDTLAITQKKVLETKRELKEVTAKAAEQEETIKDLNQQKNVLDKRMHDQNVALSICHDKRARQTTMLRDFAKVYQTCQKELKDLKSQYEGLARKRAMLSTEVANLILSLRIETERVDLAQAAFAKAQKDLSAREAEYALLMVSKENVEKEKLIISRMLTKEQDAKSDALTQISVLNHTIDQLLEETQIKQRELVLEVQAHKKTEVAKRHYSNLSNNLQATVSKLKAEISNLRSSLAQCARLLRDMASQVLQLERKNKDANEQRTVIATQLVRRNDELKASRDRVDFLERILVRGEAQYEERIFDLKLMRTEIKNLRTERFRLEQKIKEIPALRKELFRTLQDSLREQIRDRALEDELTNPLNVTRWRKLQATDPKTPELLLKVSLLQKRLISQSTKLSVRDDQLREAQRLYVTLKETLLRRPACEKQLMFTRISLNKRNRKIKALQAEMQILCVELSTSKKREKNSVKYPYRLSFPPIELPKAESFILW